MRPTRPGSAARETLQWGTCTAQRERGPHSPPLEKAHTQQQRPSAADSRLAKKENHDADASLQRQTVTQTLMTKSDNTQQGEVQGRRAGKAGRRAPVPRRSETQGFSLDRVGRSGLSVGLRHRLILEKGTAGGGTALPRPRVGDKPG